MLSPILFAVYTVDLLNRLQETGVGFHMGDDFSDALTYAHNLNCMSPSRSGLAILVK